MVNSSGRLVLYQVFQAFGSLFFDFWTKKHRDTKTGLEKNLPFSCD